MSAVADPGAADDVLPAIQAEPATAR